MNPELPQPFNQEEIRKDPKAVVIGLLIGLLLLCVGAVVFLYFKVDKKDDKIAELYETIIIYRTEKAEYYEQLNRLENERERRIQDSLMLKRKTEPLVQEILK